MPFLVRFFLFFTIEKPSLPSVSRSFVGVVGLLKGDILPCESSCVSKDSANELRRAFTNVVTAGAWACRAPCLSCASVFLFLATDCFRDELIGGAVVACA